MTKYLIIYHKEDNDGLFSMAIAYNYIINELKLNESDIDIQGHDYVTINNIDIENVINNYEHVIMTDISMFPDKMWQLYSLLSGDFIWVDHHAPIIKESKIQHFDVIPGERNIQRSAILNMYKYLYDQLDEHYQNHTEPELLRILSGWDSFSYEREGYTIDYVRNINVGTTTNFKLEPKVIIEFVRNTILCPTINNMSYWIHKLYDLGKQINDAKDEEYANTIKFVGDLTWTVANRPACALFIQGASNSLMFKSIADKVKNGIVFKRNKNKSWTVSVYNTSTKYDNEFNCGEYLKTHYNGGGHAGAAGCQISEEKFIEILKKCKI